MRPGAAGAAGWALVALAYAWWAVSLPPFSASATAAVLLAGLAAAARGAARRPPEHRRSRRGEGTVPTARLGAWCVLAVATAVWQLAAYVQAPRADHPTLSSLANALLGTHPVRAAAFALWLLGAAELARR